MKDQDRRVNMGNAQRKSDQFYATFYGLPENDSNYLGKCLKLITRPAMNFLVNDQSFRGNRMKIKSRVEFDPVQIIFREDEQGLASQYLFSQIFKQVKDETTLQQRIHGEVRDYKFDIKVELYDSRGEITEGYTLENCFIQNISHSEGITTSGENNEITVNVVFDNVSIFMFGDYHPVNERSTSQ